MKKISLYKIINNNIVRDLLVLVSIAIPGLIFEIPWVWDSNPSLGIDHYGGGSILFNKTLTEVHIGYIPDWYIGANFALYPVRYVYWFVLKILSIFSNNPITVIKLSFFLTFILSVVFSYIVIKKLYGDTLYGFLGSLLYVYVPFHIMWVGTEAIWSLSLYYALFPLCFYFFLKCTQDIIFKNKINVIKLTLSVFSLTLVLFTHPQSFLIFTFPFLIIYSLLYILPLSIYRKANLKLITRYIMLSFVPIVISLLIGAIWWLPAITQKGYLTEPFNTIEIVKNKTPPLFSILTLQGRAWTIPSFQNFFFSPVEIFVAFILTALIIFFSVYSMREAIKRKFYWALPILPTILIFIMLAMGPSAPILIYTWLYKYVPFFSNLRTPGRFLVDIILGFALILPLGVSYIINKFTKRDFHKILIISLLSMLILANSFTELNFAFKSHDLNEDIHLHYQFLSSKASDVRILTVPPYEYYLANPFVEKNNIEKLRNPWIRDPRLWTFMYGGKENLFGGSESLSVKELHEFIIKVKAWARVYSVNLSTISDVYGINYIWVDKAKEGDDPGKFFYIDNSSVKVLESENYVLYNNTNAFPKMFVICENSQPIEGTWAIAEGNGAARLKQPDNKTIKLYINFSNETKKEGRYIKYGNSMTNLTFLDEVYLEYELYNISPRSIEIILKLADVQGRHHIWISKLSKEKEIIRIPIFWFQPVDKNGIGIDPNKVRTFKIGVIEAFDDIPSDKEGVIVIKNLALLRHKKCGSVDYEKINSMNYKLDKMNLLTNMTNCKKLIIVFNYAYNPYFNLVSDDTTFYSHKIFGFLNGFEVQNHPNKNFELFVTTHPLRIYC